MELWGKKMPYQLEEEEFIPYITPFICEGAKTAIVVCPGGGYTHRAPHEGNKVGEWLNSIGVSAFVVEYRVAPYKAPAEGSDVQRAIRVARSQAGMYGIEKIGVMGFSAGGHLAATASVHYDKKLYEETDEIDQFSARPDFSVLCYPVIDMFEYRHNGSRENLIGSRPTKSLKEFYSLNLQVTEDTPPAFLWHTTDDMGVAPENSMIYAMALASHNIPYELHIYQGGRHGQGLAEENPYLHRWTAALECWMKKMEYL